MTTNNHNVPPIESEITSKCFLCYTECNKMCNWCRSVYYCSNDHYKFHRRKSKCFPFKCEIIDGKGGGRALIAAKDIRQNEVILIESASMIAPVPHSTPVCPICLAKIRSSKDHGICSKGCSLPICNSCSSDKEVMKIHNYECKVLSENKVKFKLKDMNTPESIYSTLIALRMIHLKNSDPLLWKLHYEECLDHGKERQGSGEWNMFQLDVINFIRNRLFMGTKYSDKDLHRLLGIFIVNSISLESRTSGVNGRGLFPIFSRINHDCISNARYVLDTSVKGSERIMVRARTPISQGTEITISYITSILGTHKRRKRIKSEYYFDCECTRCSDPTELGTFVSALICEACEKNPMLPKDPLNYYSNWNCFDCDFELSVSDVECKIDVIEDELTQVSTKKDLKALENFIGHYTQILHIHHYLILIAKRNYLFISRKELIGLIAKTKPEDRETLKMEFKKKSELYQDFWWIPKSLHCQETF